MVVARAISEGRTAGALLGLSEASSDVNIITLDCGGEVFSELLIRESFVSQGLQHVLWNKTESQVECGE